MAFYFMRSTGSECIIIGQRQTSCYVICKGQSPQLLDQSLVIVTREYLVNALRESIFVTMRGSVAVYAEIVLRSPRKIFIFIIKKIIYRIKIS